ncbi:MAG: DOMON domain-containing protein, partial [Planctomycetota bacterium]
MKKEKLELFESEITRILKRAFDGPFTIKFFLRRSTMSVKSLISTILLVLLCTATASAYTMQDAVGEYYIPIGVPVIDGVISPNEWDNAVWHDLNEVYYGTPEDLSNASWAALWSPDTNLIYVAVTGTDTDHIFGDYYGDLRWNGCDTAEVYIDPGNNDPEAYYFGGIFIREPAHQWICGNDNFGGSWCERPEEEVIPENPLPEEIRPTLVTSIDGNVLTYELAIPPYEWIGWNFDHERNLLPLERDMRIGLDVIMSSKSTKFAMLCEHFWQPGDDIDGDANSDGVDTSEKWKYAERYLDHSLIADPNQAWRPRPQNKTTDVAPGGPVTLKWNAGKNAAAHDVYFGTDQANVNDANTANTALYPGVFRGNQLDVNEPNYT